VRILVAGGRVLILDLRQHDQAWVRERLGDRSLGFSDERLATLLTDAGLLDVKVTVGARKTGDPFTVLIASGRKPAEPERHGTSKASRTSNINRTSKSHRKPRE
jgi:hypothetical protein